MIYINNDFTSNLSKNTVLLKKEKEFIISSIDIQNMMKNIILNYMKNFADSKDYINLDFAHCVYDFLKNLIKYLNLCNENILALETLANNLDNIINNLKNDNDNNDFENNLNSFNSEYSSVYSNVLKNTFQIEEYLCELSRQSEFKFKTTVNTLPIDVEEEENVTNSPTNDTQEENSDIEDKKQIEEQTQITDNNTLLISEIQNKIILPYKVSDLEHLLKDEKHTDASIKEIIDQRYTFSLDKYKNAAASRFREAYNLMRNKEKASIIDSLNLALELTFNRYLYPAIISACKDLDELDIYLDCLNSNELDKFTLFKIKYEILPK